MGCNFCKEEDMENEQFKSLAEQKKKKQIPSIIKEEESHLAHSSQTNSLMKKLFDTKSDDSVSVYNSQSRITSQNIGSALKLESNQRIINYVTQLSLSASLHKCTNLKNCYIVNFATPEEVVDYSQWKIQVNDNFFDRKSNISNGDIIKIKHCLTNNYLCAKQSLITKNYEVCTTNIISDECLWIIEIYDKDITLKTGTLLYLIHMVSKKLLCYSKKRKSLLINQYKILLSSKLENMKQVWRIYDQ